MSAGVETVPRRTLASVLQLALDCIEPPDGGGPSVQGLADAAAYLRILQIWFERASLV